MKNIVLGVSSSIAAYKAVYLARLFVKNGYSVKTVLTQNVSNLINPLMFQYITGNPVYEKTFFKGDFNVNHISLTDWADCFAVAPATYNVIGKFASGIADDLLSTLFAAFKKKVFICPAMNTAMWENPVNQGNIKKLRSLKNIEFINPVSKGLLCGAEGEGALADEKFIYLKTVNFLKYKDDLKGIKVLITGGGTLEYIDDVRTISNLSSGLQASLIAQKAFFRGADVLFIGADLKIKPDYVKCLNVRTSKELYEAVLQNIKKYDVFISAAAVSDFVPEKKYNGKIKSSAGLTLKLKKNIDIIKKIREKFKTKKIIGFALEKENMLQNARLKLKTKKMDIIAANDICALGGKKTKAAVLSPKKILYDNIKSKEELAVKLTDILKTLKK